MYISTYNRIGGLPMANDNMSYEQLEKLSKNPFYTLSEEQLRLLEEYRAKHYNTPRRHTNKFSKHNFNLNKHQFKLSEDDDAKTN